MASDDSRRKLEAWGMLVGEVLAILLGLAIVSWGWEEFGWGLVVIGAAGFIASSAHLVRVLRHGADARGPRF